MRILKVRTI